MVCYGLICRWTMQSIVCTSKSYSCQLNYHLQPLYPALSPPALLSNILMLVATTQFWLLTVLFSKTIGLIVNSQFLFSHFWKLYQHFVSLLTDSLYRKIFFLAAFHCIKNCLIVNSLCTGKYFYNTFYILFYILLWKESSLKLNITNIQWL